MPTVRTLVNTNHDTATVPVGVIDLFGRDDGWPCDRPSDCGNFWEQQGDLPSYLASAALTGVPGGTYCETQLYLGGTDLTVTCDINNGPSSLGSSNAWALDLMASGPNTLERFRFEQGQAGGLIRYIDSSGTPTTLAMFAGGAFSTSYTWTFTATPVAGGTFLRAVRTDIGGANPTVMASLTTTQQPAGRWMSWGCRPGQSLDNVYRVSSPLLFSDNFDRADSSSTLGPDWTVSSGTWGVSSNKAYCAVSGNGRAVLHDVGTGDYTLTCDVTLTGGSDAGLWFRWVDANNCWLLALNPLASVTLFRAVGGTFTAVATAATAGTDTYVIVTSGSSIEVYRAGALIISVTDSANASGTLVGLRSQNDTVSRWDNFSVTI